MLVYVDIWYKCLKSFTGLPEDNRVYIRLQLDVEDGKEGEFSNTPFTFLFLIFIYLFMFCQMSKVRLTGERKNDTSLFWQAKFDSHWNTKQGITRLLPWASIRGSYRFKHRWWIARRSLQEACVNSAGERFVMGEHWHGWGRNQERENGETVLTETVGHRCSLLMLRIDVIV